ncbi:hypothetical protein TNCV_3271521 [Trichonephila clavipes]|nr:hypothetical protein TNCV_3271521 [Trichonephila clavipes]
MVVNSPLSIHNRFYGFTSWSRTSSTTSIVPAFLRFTSCGMTSARGHGAIVYCLNSGSEERQTGRHNSKVELVKKSKVEWTRNYGALGQTARVCFGMLCANQSREVKRNFCNLPMRRNEGRVVKTPLVFKRVLFQERGKEGRERRTRRPGRENGKKVGKGGRVESGRENGRKEKRERTEGEERTDGRSPGLE